MTSRQEKGVTWNGMSAARVDGKCEGCWRMLCVFVIRTRMGLQRVIMLTRTV